jgi:signal transduction histidine kinase
VTLRAGNERDGKWAAVSVRDTGIEPELLPHVFESFTQGERPLHRSHSGLALGLAFVKGLGGLHVQTHDPGSWPRCTRTA